MACSNAASCPDTRRRRQASEQYRICSQSRSHFLRQAMDRPQD